MLGNHVKHPRGFHMPAWHATNGPSPAVTGCTLKHRAALLSKERRLAEDLQLGLCFISFL